MSAKVAIHGHFYQPPRKNPFTGKETEDDFVKEFSNNKFKSWNEVINEECYKPNAQMGNFELITFDLYRSLAQWLEDNDIQTYNKIIESDNLVFKEHGFGSALCGSWDHSILPLLTKEDIDLEVYWGCQDFISRFGHAPVGFWLAETAVSRQVLDVMAENGIRLVILAPWQAQHPVDTTKLYWTELREGRRMSVVFYDKTLSDGLSFDNGSMADCNEFFEKYVESRNLKDAYILGATDGERYGHHLKHGENFLNYFFKTSVPKYNYESTTLVNMYAQSTPHDEVYIQDNTSWSCLCGDLKRWREDCNCSVDYDRDNMRVNGEWKRHLHDAIMNLSVKLSEVSDILLQKLVKDVYVLKKEFIHVYLRQLSESEFIEKHRSRKLSGHEIKLVLTVCHMQKTIHNW
jgi:alpha-amylase/alpha-mannosidase (GH57 family)